MTALAWLAVCLVAFVGVPALFTAAVRHGEQQARAERAQLARRNTP